jgi:hypothetical protein
LLGFYFPPSVIQMLGDILWGAGQFDGRLGDGLALDVHTGPDLLFFL